MHNISMLGNLPRSTEISHFVYYAVIILFNSKQFVHEYCLADKV